ncbi:MAG: ribonuclease P protein component [Desulfobacteraceae bacterium]|nr:MAG: ribonuclease P protein component [Desulfobacteraceae bacterium]
MSKYAFPKTARLLKRAQFIKLSTQGKKVHTHFFIAAVLDTDTKNNRIGITVSKKVGNAVTRNRIKRLLREDFRHRKDSITGNKDINIIGKKGLATLSNSQIIAELDKLFNRIENI